MQHIYIY